MKNIRNFLSNTLINMTQSVRRFPVAVFLAAVLAFVNILLINEVIDEEYPGAFMALITGIETALVLNLSDEKGLTHIGIITGGTIAGILSALIYTVLPIARRIPISFVRSSTLIYVMMPIMIEDTTKEIATKAIRT